LLRLRIRRVARRPSYKLRVDVAAVAVELSSCELSSCECEVEAHAKVPQKRKCKWAFSKMNIKLQSSQRNGQRNEQHDNEKREDGVEQGGVEE